MRASMCSMLCSRVSGFEVLENTASTAEVTVRHRTRRLQLEQGPTLLLFGGKAKVSLGLLGGLAYTALLGVSLILALTSS
ncbi:hypothetical protein BDV98DRAFT_569891 [Pterulicium gracile]|uniref:Uncharacterized protein n=1 Tax=Pterulicium gracile TaxID=1884261 RepID=A0A5C3QDA3_9AGAR|nr:hypothetical protein BDV98DRAFT_569891 [Pterula gracilis]